MGALWCPYDIRLLYENVCRKVAKRHPYVKITALSSSSEEDHTVFGTQLGVLKVWKKWLVNLQSQRAQKVLDHKSLLL